MKRERETERKTDEDEEREKEGLMKMNRELIDGKCQS